MNLELVEIIIKVAKEFGYEDAALASFIETETGGKGFDKTTGITPPNKLGILSNVEVVHYDGKFQYQLTELPKFIVKNLSPYFMKLMESVLICFTSPEPDVVMETKWDREKNIEEEVTEFEIKEIRYPNEDTTVSKINMWGGLLDYIPILKLTGDFINKEVIEVRT